MKQLKIEETKFKARVIEKTSKGKFKLSVYSDIFKKEIGLFFIDNKQMPEDKILSKDIGNVIQFKGILKEINKKYYFKELREITRKRIAYSKKERRTALSKYDDNKHYEFIAKFNYKRDNDDRSLFTEVILKNKQKNIHLQIDHLNLKIDKNLEKDEIYSFKGRVYKYNKGHSTGNFYGIGDIINIKLNNVKEIAEVKKTKEIKEETITISKSEYDRLKEIESILKKLKSLI